jgi:hypothetical protein
MAAGPETVDQHGEIALLRPPAGPELMALRQRRCVIDAVGQRRISPGAAVHHHHGGNARIRRIRRLEQVADEHGLAVGARKFDTLDGSLIDGWRAERRRARTRSRQGGHDTDPKTGE